MIECRHEQIVDSEFEANSKRKLILLNIFLINIE